MEFKPGDVIHVKVNGEEVVTVIDEHGVQRLPRDPLVDKLFHAALLDLNKIALAASGASYNRLVGLEGTFSQADRLELYRDRLGMSVSGFVDTFPKAKIENPLWED